MREKQLLTQGSTMECHAIVVLERFMPATKCSVLLKPIDTCLQNGTGIAKKRQLFGGKRSQENCGTRKLAPKITQERFLHDLSLQRITDGSCKQVSPLGALELRCKNSDHFQRMQKTPSGIYNTGYSAEMASVVSPPPEQHVWNNRSAPCQPFSTAESDSSKNCIDKLADVEFSSPLGQKLIHSSKRWIDVTSDQNIDHDAYCNQTEISTIDYRCLRSQSDYCDDRWNLHNIHYVRLMGHDNVERTHEFGRRAKLKRCKTLKYGLNRRSRKLLHLLLPCSVVLKKETYYDGQSIEEMESSSFGNLVPDNPPSADTSSGQAITSALTSSEARSSETHDAIRKALAPIIGTNTYTCQYETPIDQSCNKQPSTQDNSSTRPLSWKELVCDEPTVIREIVDLTNDSDDETVMVQLNSPSRILLSPPTSSQCPSPIDELSDAVEFAGHWYSPPYNQSDFLPENIKRRNPQQMRNKVHKKVNMRRRKVLMRNAEHLVTPER